MREKGLEKATEAAIDAHYYHIMYTSEVCMKGNSKVVARTLKKLSSETARLELLKENFRIRTLGFGWGKGSTPDYTTAWSKQGKKKTSTELAACLRFVIKDERNYTVPSEPVVETPQPRFVPVLGTRTQEFDELNEKYEDEKEVIKNNADKLRQEREARGEGSMYSTLQPFIRPDLHDLVGKRIDVLGNVEILNEETSNHELQAYWSQGEVVDVIESAKTPRVKVLWDIVPLLKGWDKEKTEGEQVLLPSLWNKNKVGAWRMDIDIVVSQDDDEESELDNEEGIESSSDSESEGELLESDSN